MRSALLAVLAVTASAVEGPYSFNGGEFGGLTDREKEAVGESLENALGVLSGKKKSGSMFDICSDMFAEGPPANRKDATWVACKDVLPATGSLLAFKQSIVKQGGAKHPLSGSEKDAVGAALNKALGVMSGKVKGGSKYMTCMDVPQWPACRCCNQCNLDFMQRGAWIQKVSLALELEGNEGSQKSC